jgi:hypothetical protein
MSRSLDRRTFNKGLISAGATLSLAGAPRSLYAQTTGAPYGGPNVIVIRYGGGVRRRETIDPDHTYSPYLRHVLAPRGTLFTDMRIAAQDGIVTSHAQGTLYLLTGRYDRYEDVEGQFLSERYEPKAPTVFEYLRKRFDVPGHQALIINGEDRVSEDFLTFSVDHHYGVDYRSNVLSLHWFKTWLARQQLAAEDLDDAARTALEAELAKLEGRNYRASGPDDQVPELQDFWQRWRQHYGDTGLVNPRGDRLLTELAIRAVRELRPKLMMINYQDPDYVHWGNLSHYTRAISIIDQGIQQLVDVVDADPEYRDNTVFVIVPDCGRDDNPLMEISCQHHFNSRAAHEIFALVFGPGIAGNTIVDHAVDQTAIAATLGAIMGFDAAEADSDALAEAFA